MTTRPYCGRSFSNSSATVVSPAPWWNPEYVVPCWLRTGTPRTVSPSTNATFAKLYFLPMISLNRPSRVFSKSSPPVSTSAGLASLVYPVRAGTGWTRVRSTYSTGRCRR